MLPLVEIPETIARGLAPYRSLFCREAGFEHICRYVSGLILRPIEGFWRVMNEALGAGRCVDEIQQLYQGTRRVLLNHQADPIYHFSWP